MLTISGPELILIIIAFIILLIWGPQKLPELARALGKAKYYFEKASRGELEEKKEKNSNTGQSSSQSGSSSGS